MFRTNNHEDLSEHLLASFGTTAKTRVMFLPLFFCLFVDIHRQKLSWIRKKYLVLRPAHLPDLPPMGQILQAYLWVTEIVQTFPTAF